MPLYYFFHSGFPGDVPRAEIRSILRQYHYQFTSRCSAGRLEVLEITPSLDFRILALSAFKNLAGEALVFLETADLTLEVLTAMLGQVDWTFVSTHVQGENWVLRVKGDRQYFTPKEIKATELTLADKIYEAWQHPVKLRQADIQFQLIMSKNPAGKTVLCFGLLKFKQSPEVKQRLSRARALRRPFFAIGTMNNPIARVVANLSETPSGGILLDPFCGSGGILIEGAFNGNLCLGIDIDWTNLKGARQNLLYFAPDMRLGEIQANSLSLPLRPHTASCGNLITGISTDFPYGRSTTTRRLTIVALWERFLKELPRLIKPGARCCLVMPESEDVHKFLQQLRLGNAFTIVDTCREDVHDSLTRFFVVLQVN